MPTLNLNDSLYTDLVSLRGAIGEDKADTIVSDLVRVSVTFSKWMQHSVDVPLSNKWSEMPVAELLLIAAKLGVRLLGIYDEILVKEVESDIDNLS